MSVYFQCVKQLFFDVHRIASKCQRLYIIKQRNRKKKQRNRKKKYQFKENIILK